MCMKFSFLISFTKRSPPGRLVHNLDYFQIWICRDIQFWKSLRLKSEYTVRIFLSSYSKIIDYSSWVLGPVAHKSCEEHDSFPIIPNYLGAYREWICTSTENKRNESVRIWRTRGMRWILERNFAVCVLAVCTERICLFTENTRNSSLPTLRIREKWEYKECMKRQISPRSGNQNLRYLGHLSGA